MRLKVIENPQTVRLKMCHLCITSIIESQFDACQMCLRTHKLSLRRLKK